MSEPEKKGCCLLTLFKIAVLLIFVVLITVVVLGMFVLNGSYEVSRETTIKVPPEAVYKQVGDLREWPNWLPFTKPKYDDSAKVTIVKAEGVGANQTWTSDKGNGELTLTKADPEKGIEWEMVFDKKYKSVGSMTFTREGDATRVTWRMTGQNDDFLGKWMAVAMPYMVGPMFDEGLADLKAKVEAN